jgi:transaldolase
VACAEAGVTLISPFVGRILDWYKKRDGRDFGPEEDPGVLSVRRIYSYFKQHGYKTEVMGASFRSLDQIRALAGCDLLTISPELLEQLKGDHRPLARVLDPALAAASPVDLLSLDEPAFRLALNEDAMASDKLSEGIRAFVADARKLDQAIVDRVNGLASRRT